MAAYRPALFFSDSWGYLANAFAGSHSLALSPIGISNIHPSGYPALIWLLTLPNRNLAQLVAVQQLTGLLIGGLVYATLITACVRRSVAAAAAALVLLDGYAVALEQYVMADTFFVLTVLLAALSISLPALRSASPLAWRPGICRAGLAGLLVGAATIQRTEAMFILPVFIAYLAWRRVGWRPLVTFTVVLVLPLVAYAAAEDAAYGTFGMTQTSGWTLYGRVAAFADCSGAGIARAARPLCETPAERASHPDQPTWYIFSPNSPAVRLFEPGGRGAPQGGSDAVLRAFARRIILRHPLEYLATIAGDVARYFTPGASPFHNAKSATSLPATTAAELVDEHARRLFIPSVHPSVQQPASLLRAYRQVIHVPRPLLALLVLVSIAAPAVRTRGRREVFLFSGTGLALIVGTAATAGFSFRYLLPAVPLIAVGGTLALRDAWLLAHRFALLRRSARA